MQRTAWLLAFLVAVGACTGVWSLAAHSDRRTVLRAAADQLAATALLLEEHADRALEAGDRAVEAAVEAAGDPRQIRGEARAAALHDRLRVIVEDSRQIASAWVMDAEGFTVAENWSHPPLTTVAFAQRDYFQAHLQGERDRHIGSLAVGPHAGRMRFTLSRPLLTPEGEFAGVAAIGVLSDYFASVYAEAGLGPGARLALFRADGATLAIWPLASAEPPLAFPDRIPDAGAPALLLAGNDRLLAVRRLERFPVALVVSRPMDTVLAEWTTRTWRSGLLLGAVVLTLAGLTAFGLRGARQQRALTEALEAERGALERRVAERTGELAESEARFREMADNAPVIVWVTDRDGACTYIGRNWHALTGQAPEHALGQGWLEGLHPEDRAWVRAAAMAAAARPGPYRVEYRVRSVADGTWRCMMADGAPRFGASGEFLGYIGSLVDITDLREAEAQHALMARELDHRAKNALSVVQAALRLTPKSDAASYARAVEGRVAALARAHSALAERRWQGVALRSLAEAELAAFLPGEGAPAAAGRAVLSGPELMLNPAAVQALSMALHELATNATKYGALGAPEGQVALSWSVDAEPGLLQLRWVERGGPPIAEAPQRSGFGSRVIQATMGQLGGRAEHRWEAAGLTCLIELPLARVLSSADRAAMLVGPSRTAGELALQSP